ncbi:histidine phosphatase family protein [Companilactobacillus kimchii]|uniref:Phosphoglycerate mutase n=2 Tax=Companilactobacillus kimchii TaxID=2801452 RepID=A0ABR5NQA6_9LACO|nr:histidine phosphatase family protein [Companilactobacillus kimchii]KAE9562815.1 fructose-2,6-bisphosphatase [Companilactobacillus kimchii]KRK49847.1 phosphoglycerate mutase [Companilactobacillus kimchii DSM 13961 = JCM 10707]OWF33186.1 Phosphoglycerate mutase (2,3-diphosphoglycerate-independent) [Companilactobacillus kimchii]GEO46729.1 fructose 2,6-bisphosphatase [Companilactobacillus paralimentarius]
MTEFYLIRHGQTKANVMKMKQGNINTEMTYLNEHGQEQAQVLAQNFDISFADRIICSPLKRAQQTAAILNKQANLPISYDKRLVEISYGQWDGQKNADLKKIHPDAYNEYWNDVLPFYTKYATDGERFEDVVKRVHSFLKDSLSKYPNDKLICVTHGFTVKAAALDVLKPQDMMSIPEPRNTSVTKIVATPEDQKFYLEYFNQIFN